MMRNALIVSDLHLRLTHIQDSDNGLYTLPILESIKEIINKHNPEYLFNLGDTFHDKDTVSATLLEIYRQFLLSLPKELKIIQIVGNHDFSIVAPNSRTYHPTLQLKDIPNLTIVDDTYKLDERHGFMAYCPNKTIFDKRCKKLGNISTLFAHLDINGFNLGDNYVEQKTFLNMEDFQGICSRVYSGHYHEPQSLIKNEIKFTYIGSFETTDFGDSDQEKRCILLNLDTGDEIFIPTNRTFHKTIKVEASQGEYPPINMEEVKKGVNYRLVIRGTSEQIKLMGPKPKKYPAKIALNIIPSKGTRTEIKLNDNHSETLKKYTQAELERIYGGVKESKMNLEKLIEIGERFTNQAKQEELK